MIKNKTKMKLFAMILILGVLVSSVFALCSQVFDYGTYAVLEGRHNNGIASVYVTNTSNIPRFC